MMRPRCDDDDDCCRPDRTPLWTAIVGGGFALLAALAPEYMRARRERQDRELRLMILAAHLSDETEEDDDAEA